MNQITNTIRDIVSKEIRKTIIRESKEGKIEKFAIKCEGVPMGYFDTKEEAEEAKSNMSEKKGELIIEKETFDSYEEMMNKLDEMNDQIDEESDCQECGKSMEEDSEVGENAFVMAADAAKDAGEPEFEFPAGSGKMHDTTIKTDIKTKKENNESKEKTCSECGSMLNEEGVCNECGKSMYESKKRILRLKESEMILAIKKIIKESHPGLVMANRNRKESGAINKKSYSDTAKNIGKFLELGEDEEFPIQNKKSELPEKVVNKVNMTPKENEVVDSNKRGMENLQYDHEPSEAFKKRLKMALEGDVLMGNSQEAANVVKTDTGQKKFKSIKKKEEEAKEEPLYHKEPIPVKDKKESLSKLSEEISKIKQFSSYNKKTQ